MTRKINQLFQKKKKKNLELDNKKQIFLENDIYFNYRYIVDELIYTGLNEYSAEPSAQLSYLLFK